MINPKSTNDEKCSGIPMQTSLERRHSTDISESNRVQQMDNAKSPKKLLSINIKSHIIQKCQSPKKNALDPLRYIPERTTYQALFTIAVNYESCSDEYLIQRTYPQFVTLHEKLLKKYPRCKLPRTPPIIRKKRYDHEYLEQKRVELNQYLIHIMNIPDIKESSLLREFTYNSALYDEIVEDISTPSSVLEGLPGTVVTLRPGQSFSLTLNLTNSGDVAAWQFSTKKHDIGFSALFNGQPVRIYAREDAHLKAVKGSYKCSEPGTCVLNWDNTYTWSKGKVLLYWAEVETSKTQSQLYQTAESIDQSLSPLLNSEQVTVGSSTLNNEVFRSGYIAQSRNPSLYPRQIVNSSLSLIRKPFISDKKDHMRFKSGPLIIERTVKFRGRNWYRKWFVLDMRKSVLRYYDSENAARKGLNLAKLNLNSKNASLVVTQEEDVAPTPFVFVVSTKQRSWVMCASSAAEYNDWEHSISTAILAAQLSRRHRWNTQHQQIQGIGHTTSLNATMTTNQSSVPDLSNTPLSPAEESEEDEDYEEESEDDIRGAWEGTDEIIGPSDGPISSIRRRNAIHVGKIVPPTQESDSEILNEWVNPNKATDSTSKINSQSVLNPRRSIKNILVQQASALLTIRLHPHMCNALLMIALNISVLVAYYMPTRAFSFVMLFTNGYILYQIAHRSQK